MSTSIAGYTLLRKLGAGGQGEVWLARDEAQQVDVALKLVPAPGGRSDPVWLALEQEYGTSRLLDHPGVLAVERPLRDGETAILPMEFAVGGDLSQLRGRSYLEIVPILIEIAAALQHAHEHSIVHRDLKPGNVLLDAQRHIRLADFGLDGGLSPFSASPQQLEGAAPTAADDIYGLGALAYELLSGHPPYHPNFDLKRAIEGPVPPLQPLQPVPVPVAKLIQQMLSRLPKDRPRSMRHVADALDSALNATLTFDHKSAVMRPAPSTPKPGPPPVATADAIAANLTLPSPESLVADDWARRSAAILRARPDAQAVRAPEPLPEPQPPALRERPLQPKTARPEPAPTPARAAAAPRPPASDPIVAPPPPPPPAFAGAMYAEPKLPAIEPIQWSEFRVEHAPSLMRIEPVRTSRWVSSFVLAGAVVLALVWYNRSSLQQVFSDRPPALAQAAADPGRRSQDSALEQATQATRMQFEQLLAALNLRAAGLWGGAEFASAQARAAQGSAALSSGDLALALPRYKEALALLQIVATRAPSALAAQLGNGDRALAAGRGDIARQAYELARRIDPQSLRAEEGLHRARSVAAVDGSGTAQEPAAVPSPASPDADDAYAKGVGTGFAALGAGRLEDARGAFESARAIRPNGAEAAEGLSRVSAAQRARGFAAIRSRAASYEVQERWTDALKEYEQALQFDSSLSFAIQGRARAVARGELSDRLDALLDHPNRFADAAVRLESLSLLNEARAAEPSGPQLRSQIAHLNELLSQYDKPVRLALVSDNSTQVAIQRVGVFGTFARREVELKPGRYTVVGTRAGFRDVRRDVTVAPGQDLQSINVSCVEPI